MNGDAFTCQGLSARFYRLLDERDYEGLIALFAPDGRWHRQGVWLEGPEEVRAALARRPTDITVRHVLTAVEVNRTDPGIIEVRGNVLVFRAQGDLDAAPLAMPASPSTLMTICDRYHAIDGQWKLQEKSGRRILVTAAPHAGAN
jgi:hypothetical protein